MPVTNLTVGLGTLTIDGTSVGWLKGDVTYNVTYSMADYATGQPLQVHAKVITEYPKAALKANMAELTNILPFLPSQNTYEMPTHEVVFQTYERVGRTQITISFSKAVLTSAGIKVAETGYTLTDINIEAVGSIPTITTEVVGTPSTYAVSYSANGGSGGPSDGTAYASGETVTVKFTSPPTRSGYAFAGWATSAGGSAVYTSGGTTTFSITSNKTLYAVWAPTYSVSYNANGGSGGPTDSTAYVGGNTVTVKFTSPPTWSGHVFQGWATSAGGSAVYTSGGTTTFSISGSTTLYAVWEAVPTYNLTYNNNGGTGGPGGPFAYTENELVTIQFVPAPSRGGQTFLGWSFVGGDTSPMFSTGGTTTFNMPAVSLALYAIYA